MKYFHICIQHIVTSLKNPFFIFLSDEPDFIEKEFAYINNKIISKNMPFMVDFAVMTLCEGAILSPSSFGWWGSFFMKNKTVVFAPKNWLGFFSNVEYHKNPLASYMTAVDIYSLAPCSPPC